MAQFVEPQTGDRRPVSSHCVLSWSKTLYPMLSTCSTQEDRKSSRHDCKIYDLDVKHENKQTRWRCEGDMYVHQ